MGFQQGLSGLNTSSKSLDVIGNNVANASVVGFKPFRTQMADVFAASLSGSGTSNIGIGSAVGSVMQQFLQGNISVTNNPLDVAINGQGFFRLSNNGAISYSRNGQFQVDKTGYVVNDQGRRLTGYPADANGNIISSAPVDIQINTTDLLPKQTAAQTWGINLDSREAVISVPFNSADGTTFNRSTSQTIYDSLGNPHTQAVYFQKASANNWNMYVTVDGTAVPVGTFGSPAQAARLTYGTNGTITGWDAGAGTQPISTPIPINIPGALTTSWGAATQNMTMQVSTFTQFGSVFSVNKQTQDGYSSGRLNGISISPDGTVLGRYTNGQSRNMAQIVLANFSNPQGLQPRGGNEWTETPTSGGPLVGAPGSSSLGVLQSSAVEESKVDLTEELVNMITAQRVYQANAQTIKTQDQVLQTLVNLR
ncbi:MULTISPECIES: flagellar hook protein FlgE [Leeia]|uniref:Flagellar hook protein FlgE n=1 Tax=Leeia aquatica TaxID=2725557 RepID=A0A847S1U6_9NEIS|nr:flagellar hook protein FlgE [Leeia aquatica]NLR75811.1 flagellar hook protein FlgE [Leeia aquatica]